MDKTTCETNGELKKIENFNEIPVFMAGVPNVRPVFETEKCREIQKKVASMLGWTRPGFPASVPVPMDLDNLKLLSQEEYIVSIKADGTRYLMLIDGPNDMYFINRNNQVFQIDNLLPFPCQSKGHEFLESTLVDGEMLEVLEGDQCGGDQVKFLFLIFDLMTINGECVMAKNIKKRRNMITEKILEPRNNYLKMKNLDSNLDPFQFEAQRHWAIQDAKLVYQTFSKMYSYKNDGLMFNNANDPYNYYPDASAPGRADKTFKWKPENVNTVDFLLKISNGLGNLFVSDMPQPFGHIKLNKLPQQAKQKLDGKIVECQCQNGEWIFYRHRWDKSMPNNVYTATGTLKNIEHPVTEKFLYKFIKENGFKATTCTPSTSSEQ